MTLGVGVTGVFRNYDLLECKLESFLGFGFWINNSKLSWSRQST